MWRCRACGPTPADSNGTRVGNESALPSVGPAPRTPTGFWLGRGVSVFSARVQQQVPPECGVASGWAPAQETAGPGHPPFPEQPLRARGSGFSSQLLPAAGAVFALSTKHPSVFEIQLRRPLLRGGPPSTLGIGPRARVLAAPGRARAPGRTPQPATGLRTTCGLGEGASLDSSTLLLKRNVHAGH